MTWIDFKKLKASLDFGQVLEMYGVAVKHPGRDRLQIVCPLPTHQGTRKPSLSLNIPGRMWQCFGCGAKGNILDFAVRMERLDPARPAGATP